MPNSTAAPLGLSTRAGQRLQVLTGAEPVVRYSAMADASGMWRESHDPAKLAARDVPMITNTWSAHVVVEGEPRIAHLADGFWIDADCKEDPLKAKADTLEVLARLAKLGIDPACCSLFATGSKGFHVYVPLAAVVANGVDGAGLRLCLEWPRVVKNFVVANLKLATVDLSIYSGGRGRLWRQPNTERDNGAFKVQITRAELGGLQVVGDYVAITSTPRPLFDAPAPAPRTDNHPALMQAYKDALALPKPLKAKAKTAPAEDRAELVKLLKQLPQQEYGDWLRVGSAIKSIMPGDDGLQVWDAWSKQFRGYRRGECSSRWGGLDGKARLGTLVYLAKQSRGAK